MRIPEHYDALIHKHFVDDEEDFRTVVAYAAYWSLQKLSNQNAETRAQVEALLRIIDKYGLQDHVAAYRAAFQFGAVQPFKRGWCYEFIGGLNYAKPVKL